MAQHDHMNAHLHADVTLSERQKARLCSEWLSYCHSIGWKRADMKFLCDLFWKHTGWKTFKGYKP